MSNPTNATHSATGDGSAQSSPTPRSDESGDGISTPKKADPCPTCGDAGSIEEPISQDRFGVWDTRTHDCPDCYALTTVVLPTYAVRRASDALRSAHERLATCVSEDPRADERISGACQAALYAIKAGEISC